MLSGLGDVFVKTTGLSGGATAQKMLELFLFNFEFVQEAEPKEAQGFVGGKLQTKSSAEATVSNTLTLSTQYIDWAQLGFTLDQFKRVATNETMLVPKRVTVPTSAPYEITDAAITAANTSSIFATVTGFGTWGQPGALARATTPASPASGEVGVDTTNTKLVFNAAQAGAPITYTVPVTYASVETYGGSGTLTRYGNIEFYGKLYSPESTDEFQIYFPNLQRSSRPTITIADDVPTLEIQFGAIAPAGWEEPYKVSNLDTAVLA
ncbi:MAG TPA: hypothetical protein IGS53_12725 [Leptolyngbyaceae cyanobacterium M33_DOE_097]|uniref:Uncharacterized protein n=1 Tax=Oscillatoriales cyanobacterium SpSt-418 TaxID=2282169 RepID=A0A7C3KGL7_9CYAN|nr:hypothetical protein [Leptolyngbyaceae cyanobacterium M33_DOE_097]